MGIQYRLTLYLSGLATIMLLALCYAFYVHSKNIAIEHAQRTLGISAKEQSDHIETFLIEKTKIVLAIANTDLVNRELLRSNTQYSALSTEKRKSRIEALNERWKNTPDNEDTFVQSYTKNRMADYLRNQQQRLPGEFGEVFATNRYGLVVGTTNKLTTLAHKHKYWWQAASNRGQGRIFFDDRGFDKSVQGYVIGIVVPVMQNGQIIGILKANLNLLGSLQNFVTKEHGSKSGYRTSLVRSGGLVILEQGKKPLSTKVGSLLTKRLAQSTPGSVYINAPVNGPDRERLIAYAPIGLTQGSVQYGFGGNYKAIDHIYGNTGESWYVLVSQDMTSIAASTTESVHWLLQIGLIFVIAIGVLALIIGNKIAKPIISLTSQAKQIGQGNLDVSIDHDRTDELGTLASTLDKMTSNLKETTVSRDSLAEEVDRSQALASELREQSVKDELTGLYNRRGFRELAEQQLKISERNKLNNFMLYADVDYLKQINDEMGHNIGDNALIDISDILKDTFRGSDVIARLGGDEFAVLLIDDDSQDIESIDNRLHKIIDNFNMKTERPYKLSLSVGIIRCDFTAEWSLDRAMSTADTLMYAQKKERKSNRIKVVK